MLIKRMPNGDVTASPGGLTEALWLYVWATGDGNLGQLANELVARQHEEQEKEETEESRAASPTGLAKLAHWRLGKFRVDGARKLISDFRRKSGSAAGDGSRYEGPADRSSREQALKPQWRNQLHCAYADGL